MGSMFLSCDRAFLELGQPVHLLRFLLNFCIGGWSGGRLSVHNPHNLARTAIPEMEPAAPASTGKS